MAKLSLLLLLLHKSFEHEGGQVGRPVNFVWCVQILFGKAVTHLHMMELSQLVGLKTKEVNHGSMQGIQESVPLYD